MGIRKIYQKLGIENLVIEILFGIAQLPKLVGELLQAKKKYEKLRKNWFSGFHSYHPIL